METCLAGGVVLHGKHPGACVEVATPAFGVSCIFPLQGCPLKSSLSVSRPLFINEAQSLSVHGCFQSLSDSEDIVFPSPSTPFLIKTLACDRFLPSMCSFSFPLPQHMDYLLSRCSSSRLLGFFVVLSSGLVSVDSSTATTIRSPPPFSPFQAWSIRVAATDYAFIAGSDYYQPRRYIHSGSDDSDGLDDLLLVALLSPAAAADPAYQLNSTREEEVREAFGSYKNELARDRLEPPPKDLTNPASVRDAKGGGTAEWWW